MPGFAVPSAQPSEEAPCPTNGRLWLVALSAAVVGALLGAGAVWATQQSAIASLNARLIQADADTQAALQKADELATELEALKATAVLPEPTSAHRRPPRPCLRRRSRRQDDEAVHLHLRTIDRVRLRARHRRRLRPDAHRCRGGGGGQRRTATSLPRPTTTTSSTRTRLLRKLKVKPGISVNVATNDDGTSDPNGHTVTFAELGRQLRRTHCRERGHPHGAVLDRGQGRHHRQDQAAVPAVGALALATVSGASCGRSPSPCARPA